MNDSSRSDEVFQSFIEQHGVKDVNHGLIYEECLEEQSHYCSSFAENKYGTVNECPSFPVEYSKERDLWQICEYEQVCEDEEGEEGDGNES
jgi:hypothetical protein